MKKIFLILIIIIIIITIIFIIKRKKEVEISKIKYFNFGYTTGNMIDAYVSYNIELKDKKYLVSIKPTRIPEEETLKIEISPKEMNKIKKILKENEVGKWDGFQKSDKNVLDGNSFSLSVRFTNNDSISASGYMKYPNNYKKVQDELDKFFMNIYNKNKK